VKGSAVKRVAKEERAKRRRRPWQPPSPPRPGRGMSGVSVDPYATTPKADRPMLPQQRSELAALSRDPFLTFDYQQTLTLTRGRADRLIARLRKLAEKRHRAQLHEQRQQRKQRQSITRP
jgi:hypothetical protein